MTRECDFNQDDPEVRDPEVCKTCRYWAQDDEHKHIGQCHRHAPLVILVDPTVCADSAKIFPSTDEIEWCGEYGAPLCDR